MLVSLGVLGLIAGLTVPSIINSVETAKKKALLKEALQIVTSVIQAGVLNGDFQNITTFDTVNQNGVGSISNYFTSKFNAKQCVNANGSKDVTSNGCNRGWNNAASGGYVDHYGKWLLPNGAKISFDYPQFVTQNSISFHIFLDAYANYVSTGKGTNIFTLTCNITEAPYPRNGDPKLLKSGTCEGWNDSWQNEINTVLGFN